MPEQFSGNVEIQKTGNGTTITLNGNTGNITAGGNGQDGDLYVRDSSGREVLRFNGDTAVLYIGANGNEGDIRVRDGAGREVFNFNSDNAALYIGASGNEGDIIVRDGSGRDVFHFDSNYAALYIGANGNEGDIFVRDGAGNNRIHLDGNTGDIKLEGADCAEEFDMAETEEIDPGAVVVIDGESKLRPCRESYDKKVAGVVSGANGLNPAIILDKNTTQNKRLPVALNGKVYCKVDAGYSPVETGDLLTTSPTAGHAMRADDPLMAFGAVIGKALRPLREGRGLIPILVALQ